jgi:hypothetical protein
MEVYINVEPEQYAMMRLRGDMHEELTAKEWI